MRKARIYITNDPGLDFVKAEPFGDLVKMTAGPVNPFQPDKAKHAIYSQLAEFDYVKDLLCPSGSTLAVGLAFAYLTLHADWDPVTLKLLLFNSKTREYFERVISL